MKKYGWIELPLKEEKIIEKPTNNNVLSTKKIKDIINNTNVIYIYLSTFSNKVYIGQTKHFFKRNNEHYILNKENKKFIESKFNKVLILFGNDFNRSVLDDIESQLISYFLTDNSLSKKNSLFFNHKELINATSGNSVNEYNGKEDIVSDIILPFWNNVLYKKNIVNFPLNKLKNDVLMKYSPFVKLSSQQIEIIKDIISHPEKNYVINGDAGTGKTVLLTHLVASLLQRNPNKKIAVIVQNNWKKIGNNIFKVYGMNSSNLIITTATSLINSGKYYDIIIIDEAHRLPRKYTKQVASILNVYKGKYKNCTSHLEILKQLSDQLVLMYDVFQTIRPADITRKNFQKLTQDFKKFYLKTQFRIQTSKNKNYTSEDYINGIKYLLYKDTGILDLEYAHYNKNFNKEVFRDKTNDAYFGYFSTNEPLHKLKKWIDCDSNIYPNHINRIVASFVEPWKAKDGKDLNKKQWNEGNLHLRWNSTAENWINSKSSKNPDAEDQIGSIFAVQGIDLNNVGVLIGDDLKVDDKGHLCGNPDHFYNVNGKLKKLKKEDSKKEDLNLQIQKNKKEFTLFVLNIYYVLLTRGIDGIRLGFWHNDAFRKYMEKTLNII